MLFEGASRAGFRPLRPEIKAKEPTAIATSATIRNARSAGIPKRRSARLIATKMRVSPIGRKRSPTPTFVRLEEIEAPRSRKLRAKKRQFDLHEGARLLGKLTE